MGRAWRLVDRQKNWLSRANGSEPSKRIFDPDIIELAKKYSIEICVFYNYNEGESIPRLEEKPNSVPPVGDPESVSKLRRPDL